MTKRWKPFVRDSRKRQTHPDTGQTTRTKVRTGTDSQDNLQKGQILTHTTDRKGESKTKGERDKWGGYRIQSCVYFWLNYAKK